MKIEEIRPSFTVYLIGSDQNRLEGLGESLGLAGYLVANFTELTAAFSEIFSNPPHFILFDFQEVGFNLQKAIKQVAVQLPESHIFLVTPIVAREQAAQLLEHGVSDMILTPLATPLELIRALDRSAERDYFMYANEQLSSKAESDDITEEPARAIAQSPSSDSLDFARRLFERETADECLLLFMETVANAYDACPMVYFKYFGNRRVLAATQQVGIEQEISQVGINFNELRPTFRTSELRDPMSVAEIAGLIEEVFATPEHFSLPIEVMGELIGVMVFLKPAPEPQLLGYIRDWSTLTSRALTLLEAEKRLHVLNVKDPGTDLYTRNVFTEKLREEISRARRTLMPVTLIQVAVDQYGQIVTEIGQEEAETLLKVVAKVFAKHSRINDVLGRTGADEFGIVLPHTPKDGGLVKAERIRKLIESADFGRVLKLFPRITISLGVSEYPSMVRDAEDLMQLADEALFQVRPQGNKTCSAKPPEGFTPDFASQSES